jgi:hypothetical protein
MTVLESLELLWRSTEALTALVPADRVLIGPPMPGLQTPAVALESYEALKGDRVSIGSLAVVRVRALAEAAEVETLETLAEAMVAHLVPWSSDRYVAMAIRDWNARIARNEDSANEHWLLEMTLEYLCERQ